MNRHLLALLRRSASFAFAITAACLVGLPISAATPVILTPPDASPAEALAAREVRRYLYLCTGTLLPIQAAESSLPAKGGIVVARKDRSLVATLLRDPRSSQSAAGLEPGAHWLKTVELRGARWVSLIGGDDPGTLYAAYRFAEHLGVRFYLHGDAVPDHPAPFRLPMLDETANPLFALRGIQPFHDFPEGPDWWNTDDYLAVLGQLPKLRMNFFGLHTYPEDRPNAEPTVWIGPPSGLDERDHVKSSYPSSYQNTLRGNWGYETRATSNFLHGASQLFEHDAFGADVMIGHCPQPSEPAAANEVFSKTASMLQTAFQEARALGIKTCVGTETPLIVPKLVQERLRAAGRDPSDRAVVRDLYEGMFRRVQSAYAPDYYWFWTPEGWTWEGTRNEQVRATLHDLEDAIEAHRKLHPNFRLATCGWVLGPQQDRALFDKVLPKDIAVSCINREVGRTPVDRGFIEVRGRGKWAIPWMEDDPALTSPQLWVGRMRRDAADAYRYGCDGLMGIHWRTRVLGPNVLALARAAWTQSPWSQPFAERPERPRVAGPVGGTAAGFPDHPIADTEEDPVYQTVRYNLTAYHLPFPNGTYRVMLKFCEPHYTAPLKRVFGVRLQGATVIDGLDIFAKAGQNRALDYTFDSVTVTNGWLSIDFVPQVEFPSIAGIVVTGSQASRRINCGGGAWNSYEADLPGQFTGEATFPAVDDFYEDWARSEFGPDAGLLASRIFARIDCRLPRPSDWVDGPGGLKPDPRPWPQAAKDYAFVDDFASLEPMVIGAGNQERYGYWLHTFRYMRAMAHVDCLAAEYNKALAAVKGISEEKSRRDRAQATLLPLRIQLVQTVAEVYANLLALTSNPGELGTIANWDQHLVPGLLERPGKELATLLGAELPAAAQPSRTYAGALRLIVTTQRTSLPQGETLDVRARLLSASPVRSVRAFVRPLGKGAFITMELPAVGRGVHRGGIKPPTPEGDFEYYVESTGGDGTIARWPATAPAINHTVVRTTFSR